LNSEDNNTQNLELQTKNRFAAFDFINTSFAAMSLRMKVAIMFSSYASLDYLFTRTIM